MEQATCWLYISKVDSVPLKSITPAELHIMVAMHQTRAGKHPVHSLVVDDKPAQTVVLDNNGNETEDSHDRTDREEADRLRAKYGHNNEKVYWFDTLYPGQSPKIPQTFGETGLLEQSTKD